MSNKITYPRKKVGNQFSHDNANEIMDVVNSNADILDAVAAGTLGTIKPTDPAPTPARNGNYTFSIGGTKPAWLIAEAGITTVKAGDGVAVVYNSVGGTYTYTHVNISTEIVQTTGQEINKVMSQKAVTDNISSIEELNKNIEFNKVDYLTTPFYGYLPNLAEAKYYNGDYVGWCQYVKLTKKFYVTDLITQFFKIGAIANGTKLMVGIFDELKNPTLN
ncbi:MAG: hypothetical protein WBJ13_08775, partial [Sedimentibacter sp.]